MGHSSVCEINKIVARSLMRNFTVGKCSVHFSSVTQLCPTLCDPMNRSTPGLPVHHQLTEFTQTHVQNVSIPFLQTQRTKCPLKNKNTTLSLRLEFIFKL